jgi:hypothetical protein
LARLEPAAKNVLDFGWWSCNFGMQQLIVNHAVEEGHDRRRVDPWVDAAARRQKSLDGLIEALPTANYGLVHHHERVAA